MMLEKVLDFIHNYFVKDVHKGNFKVEGGNLVCDFLMTDQYFKIVGSVFNDGVYKYPASNLTNEEFTGEVWSMAVPPSVLSIVKEVEDWNTEYGDKANSPYSSESFAGYSYTKASSSSDNKSSSVSWQSVFGSRLNHWRKIS